MGKSAGNAPLELVSMRLNEKYGKSYNINPMLEAIQESIMGFYDKAPWGYKMFFYLCALNDCHPNYLTLYKDKQNLSVSKLNDILSMIEPEDKKLLYDKIVAEQLYDQFVTEKCSEDEAREKLSAELKKRNILVVGPGKNIELQKARVDEYIAKENPYVISINYIPKEIKVDAVFTTNVKRYHDMKTDGIKVIATTNVECRNGKFDFVFNRAPLLERNEKIMDNSFLMLIKLLESIGINKICCAGFDGYSDKEDNYFNPEMEYYFVKDEAHNLNTHMRESIYEARRTMDIRFLTYSAYDTNNNEHDEAF